jgi:hypothetical protein
MAKNDNTLLLVGGALLAYVILSKKATAAPVSSSYLTRAGVPMAAPSNSGNLITTAGNLLTNLLKTLSPPAVTPTRDYTPLTAADPAANLPLYLNSSPVVNPADSYFNQLMADNIISINDPSQATYDVMAADQYNVV